MTTSPRRSANAIAKKWRSREQDVEKCRRLLRKRSLRTVFAFYANPQLPPQLNLKTLTGLTREMKWMLKTISPFDVHIEPCSNSTDLKNRILQMRPRVVIGSCHSYRGLLILEDAKSSRGIVPENRELLDAFRNVEILILIGCDSEKVLQQVMSPHQQGIGFSSIVEDRAATLFAQGLISELARQIKAKHINAHRLFSCAVKTFTNGGFNIGDPAQDSRLHGIPVFVNLQ